jgi:putative peptidoglycan lipid II flippase
VNRQRTRFGEQMSSGIRITALLTLPAAAGLLVLRRPIVGLMQRGQFDAVAAHNTARALAGLAIGLTAFSIYLFVMRGFYAHHDTRTPFVLNVFENIINIVLAVVLIERWGVLGLGLAYAISYVIASLWALQVMSYKVTGFSLRSVLGGLWRPTLAAVLMAEAMWLVTRNVDGDRGWQAIAQLLVAGTVGLSVYGVVLYALRVPDLGAILDRLKARRSGLAVGAKG